MLLKKRVKVRRQEMTALVTVDGGLEGPNENSLLHAAIVPVLVTRRQDREVTTTKMVVFFPGVRHDCRLERRSAGNPCCRKMFTNSRCYRPFRFSDIASILSTGSAISAATREEVNDAGGFRHSELIFGTHE